MAWVAPFDPFEALGLERGATPRTIKSKYHELARRYHPNRNQGTDDAKTALCEYFHYVNQAWQLLSEPEKRRRYIELLDLYDLHEAILTSTADLSEASNPNEQRNDQRKSSDGQVSSDADDDDLPRIAGLKKRETFDRPARGPSGLDGIPEGSDDSDQSLPKDRRSRLQSRASQLRGRVDSGRDSDASDQNVAAERRRKFDRLRRKELEAFNTYRDAMVDKFEAEEAAERSKELYEQARWRREYFERAPRETNQRMRLIRLFNNATKAFTAQQLPVGRRKGSSVSQGGQILSTGDPLQQNNNQFLNLPSRTKSIRRKGFTSDISADQTSSDEDQSEEKPPAYRRHARTASSPAPNHRRHRSGDTIPTSLRITPRRLPNANQDPISPVTGPGPNIFVRAATNLHEMVDEQAEQAVDRVSVPASSRSSSPEEVDPSRGRFRLLPHFSTSEMFGSEREGRSRSASADRRTPKTNGNLPRTPSPYSDASFSIKHIERLEYKNIAVEHVHELSDREKLWMLSVEPDDETNPFQLLQDLSRLDAAAAARLTVKADIKKEFKFRLVYSHREVLKNQHQSFIALSYRRKLHVEKKGKHYSLPLDSEMFQAVWDERLSDKEGVWIDQICIDQESDMEKNVSMSAMDMVYRSARLVVVALDDIDLDANEGQILKNHMEDFNRQSHVAANKRFRRRQPPYLDKHDDLYLVIRKILRSSWFRRAWCRHEMRLAREHIFLVPCRNLGSTREKGVLRFTGKTLTHFLGMATEVAFEPSIEAVKPALYAFFRDRSKLSPEHHLRSHHGNFTTVIAEVFAMEAGGDPKVPDEQREADARKDKVAIILNTMECGLALRQEVRRTDFSLPMYECNYMLLLLALAARDPGALCSVGHPLRALPYDLSSSWLLEPTNVDSGLNNYRTLNRLPEHFRITTHCEGEEQYVQLDLKFLSPGRVVRPLESVESLGLAKYFMDVCEQRRLGRNRKRYLLNDRTANQLFGSMRDIYIQVLVCLFECGPDWMSEVCQRYGVSRWRYDLPHAYDLLIAFKNTSGKWPEHAWKSEAAGFIMDFVNFLIIRGLPQRQTTQPEEWRPICVSTTDGIGRVLTFIPPGDIRVAVPAALLDADYLHLARLFVMEPRGSYDPINIPHYSEWTLRGKSVLFSDETASDLLELDDNGTIRGGQKVFGRTS